ncbi:MAG: hypothetical protein QM641_12130, partial [Microbacterium sp.]
MGVLEDISDAVGRLGVFAELNVDAGELPASAVRLSDQSVRDALGVVAGVVKQATMLQSVLVGVAAARSGRDRGHGGLVQGTGHRNAVEFVRDVTGVSRGEAIRAVKVGEALLDGHGDGHGHAADPGAATDAGAGGADGTDAGASPDAGSDAAAGVDAAALPWHEPLRV